MSLTLGEAFDQARALMPQRKTVFSPIWVEAKDVHLVLFRTPRPGDKPNHLDPLGDLDARGELTLDFVPTDRQEAAGNLPPGLNLLAPEFFQSMQGWLGRPVPLLGMFRLYQLVNLWKIGGDGPRVEYGFECTHPDYSRLSAPLRALPDGSYAGRANGFSPNRQRGVSMSVSLRITRVYPEGAP